MDEYKQDQSAVIACATAIAGYMFQQPDTGLEVRIRDLENALPQYQVADIVEVLVAARIGRRSGSTRGRFSFVHRRFNEYFFVRFLRQSTVQLQLEAIPTDSKWRDSLVLYTEVAPAEEAKKIATYCWDE